MSNEYELIQLDEQTYDAFARKHPYADFLNSIYAAHKLSFKGWKVTYLGLTHKGTLLGAALCAFKSIHVGNYFYIPRGMLIDYSDMDMVKRFVSELQKYMKQHRGVYLKIDPNVKYQERDENGTIKPDGKTNSLLIQTLKELGFVHGGFTTGYRPQGQCRWMSVLHVSNKDEASIFSEFSYRTRQDIRTSQKEYVHIRELQKDELSILADLELCSSKRQNFKPMSITNYEQFFDTYGEHCKALYAYVDIEQYAMVLNKEKQQWKEQIETYQSDPLLQSSNKKKNRLHEAEVIYHSILKKEVELRDIRNIYQKELPLSAALFIKYGKEIVYLESGSAYEYRRFCGPYAIQWAMIKEAIQEGYEDYNFYGISGLFDKDDIGYGVFDFKRGFHAEVVELIGDFELPLSKPRVFLYRCLKKFIH